MRKDDVIRLMQTNQANTDFHARNTTQAHALILNGEDCKCCDHQRNTPRRMYSRVSTSLTNTPTSTFLRQFPKIFTA